MAFEDKTLRCAGCGTEFVFSVGEQQFHQEKGFTTEPRKCKPCRAAAKQNKQKQNRNQFAGEYRSPAFDKSAPRQLRTENRPRGPQQRQGDYRSPSFRDKPDNFEADYRSPAFREVDAFNPQEEYRAPGFKEYDSIKPEDEYRSPAFGAQQQAYRDERPMFHITCVACGKDALVPFIPEEKEDPMCKECYKEHKEMMRREAEQTPTAE